jgi:hypothetical protein
VDNYWYFANNLDLGLTVTKAQYWNVFWQVNAGKKEENLTA